MASFNYLDPHRLWSLPTDDGSELVFNHRAAVLHVFKPYWVLVSLGFLLLPSLIWRHLKHPEFDGAIHFLFLFFIGLPALGIFLPAFVVWTYQVIREIQRGPWLRVDRHDGDVILPHQNLRLMRSQVRWSLDVHERIDDGQRVCRTQLLMLIDDESGRTQTICITARYGKKSKAKVRAMCGEYAQFTGTKIDSKEGKCERPTLNVQLPTSK